MSAKTSPYSLTAIGTEVLASLRAHAKERGLVMRTFVDRAVSEKLERETQVNQKTP